jgi:hypothetical protein
LVPGALELVTYNGRGFWSVVVSRLHAMRPRALPAWIGVSYWHVGYRLYVRLPLPDRAPIEGLYFLRSDCDSRLMTHAGNLLTDFSFHTAAIEVVEEPDSVQIAIRSPEAAADIALDRTRPPVLPPDSAFASLEEAAEFLKYKPAAISVSRRGHANVVTITRDEAAWRSRLVHVVAANWSFFRGRTPRPEICYEVAPIAYQWNRGRTYRI